MKPVLQALAVLIALSVVCPLPGHAQPAPQGVIVNPEASELKVEVWPERERYLAGERLELGVRLSQPAHLYLYSVNADGKITLLFPNAYQPDNALPAGEHAFPTQRYSLVLDGPPGTEVVQAIASAAPLDVVSLAEAAPGAAAPFAPLGDEPERLVARLQGLIAETLPPEGWATGWTRFQIVRPSERRWIVRTDPSEAELYLDGELVGLTPEELRLDPPERAGEHREVELTLVKDGYGLWSGVLRLTARAGGEVETRLLPQSDGDAARLTRVSGSLLLDVRLRPQGSSGQPASSDGSGTPSRPSNGGGGVGAPSIPLREFDRFGGSLAVNLGGHPAGLSTFGVEFGLGLLRFGLGIADTGEDVPAFYDVGEPVDLGPERVYNDGPETQIYAKLALGLGLEGWFVELGGGVVQQVRAHVAAPLEAGALDVGVQPNGYRTETLTGAAVAGLAYRVGGALLQVGYDTHRGWVGGLGVAF